MRILFFFVHPSIYYLFKYPINHLKEKGHTVDITIVTKDVLEDLVRQEGWEYTNIFPEGRRNPNLPILVATGINFLKTIARLHTYTKGKPYDLFITDDSLVVTGQIRRIPTLFFVDQDISTVIESGVLMAFATKILAPSGTYLGIFERKKIGFNGYKALSHLHPHHFKPDSTVVDSLNLKNSRYFILRLVSMTACQERRLTGLTDEKVEKLISLLEQYGDVFITTERELPQKFAKYQLRILPQDIAHVLYYADMFIGDSPTMVSEAAVLGVPSLIYHGVVGKLYYLNEKEHKYGLLFGFKTEEFDKLYAKVEELLATPNLKAEWQKKRQIMLNDKSDVTEFLINVIENYTDYI